MPVGTTLYHVSEAMKLGAIAPTVGTEHTLSVLRPSNTSESVKDRMLETSWRTEAKLDRTFAKSREMRGMSLPRHAWAAEGEK
jgi:hypothetical protein